MEAERRDFVMRDKETAVTYRPEFVAFRCDQTEGEGYKARVRVKREGKDAEDFTATAYNYQEAKSEAFRKAASAIGV